MKVKQLFIALIAIFILFVLSRIIPSGKIYYGRGEYFQTMKDEINGVVTRIVEGKNFFGIVVNNNESKIYPFTYVVEKMPANWHSIYPKEFIQIDDSIFKHPQSDTFYVIRGNQKWRYFLPQ